MKCKLIFLLQNEMQTIRLVNLNNLKRIFSFPMAVIPTKILRFIGAIENKIADVVTLFIY